MRIPVITIHNPWAEMIAFDEKTIETRNHDRFKSLVGQRIGIHSSKKCEYVPPGFRYGLRGYILATAYVSDHRQTTDADRIAAKCDGPRRDYMGRYGLFLSDVWPIVPPIKISGHQGIWYYDLDFKSAYGCDLSMRYIMAARKELNQGDLFAGNEVFANA